MTARASLAMLERYSSVTKEPIITYGVPGITVLGYSYNRLVPEETCPLHDQSRRGRLMAPCWIKLLR